ncbi:YdcF family protein [Denitrobaculum tricleocarpae]|uniref:YdcF family protein n=1 Tax=Denitrobaculum tricleocarpae TaxID=2591009 RepID=A0A545TGI0_9PROT|nr:YdcF family protein [Denitrobaculum tricleocarpae]
MSQSRPLNGKKRKYDVIVVLGAAVWSRGRPSPTLDRRVRRGLELFRAGEADRLLFTGGLGRHPPAEAEVMRRIALDEGIDTSRIEVESASRNTMENAVNSAKIMTDRGWNSAVLVSDRIHLPRAALVFRSLGIKVRVRGVSGAWSQGPFRRWWHYPLYEMAAFFWYLGLIVTGRHRSEPGGSPH